MIRSSYDFRKEMLESGKYELWASRAVDTLIAQGFADMEGRFSAKETAFIMAIIFQVICDYHEWLSDQLENVTLDFIPPIQGD